MQQSRNGRKNILESLTTLFPKQWIRRTASETDFIKRSRKVDPVVFLWSLILGFGVGLQRTLADLRRVYESQAGHKIVPSAYYDRFTPELVQFLKRCVEKGIDNLVLEPNLKMGKKLQEIRDLVAIDSTMVRLHELLAKKWPGPRTNHSPASVKINTIVSVFGETKTKVRVVEGKRAESKLLSIGKWVKDRLLLFDLGYFGFKNFREIVENGGFFISRLKSNSNPIVLRSLKQHRGRSIKVDGLRFSEIKAKLKRGICDFEVWATTSQSKNIKTLEKSALLLRVVGIWDKESNEYHFYITNLPVEKFTAEDIAALYRVRWTIEMLFKELKSCYKLECISSGKECIVEALLYTALLTLIVSRKILSSLRVEMSHCAPRMKSLRWANVFYVASGAILKDILIYEGINSKSYNDWYNLLVAEAIDPNMNRESILTPWIEKHDF